MALYRIRVAGRDGTPVVEIPVVGLGREAHGWDGEAEAGPQGGRAKT